MVEKEVEICHTIHQYAKANKKYMKNYHKKHRILSTELSYQKKNYRILSTGI